MTNSFWDSQRTGQSTSPGGGTSKTTAEMQTQSTFTDASWDFASTPIWKTNASLNSGYPYFEWAESVDPALPVELICFNAVAADRTVHLNWLTATEVNNYGFEIERQNSEDGNQESDSAEWETIGFVQGHGNSNSPKSYEFIDEEPPAGNVEYRLKQIDTDGSYEYYSTTASVNNSITDVAEEQVPTEFSLSQNYPNPFNPSTTIRFGLPESGRVMLELYNMLGQSVEVLLDDYLPAGYQEVIVNGSEFSSGVYTYRISVKGERKSFISTKKFVLMK